MRRYWWPFILSAVIVGALLFGLPARATTVTSPAQWIHVNASGYSTSYATFTAWQLESGRWVRVLGPWTARVGYNGVAPPGQKREGDGRTPSGTYGFSFAFGVSPRPSGVALPWRHAYSFDVWDDDPASPRYNTWCDLRYRPCGRPGFPPEPMHQVPVYDYAAVIAYNTARIPGLGSAVFLHVGNGGSTAGCVSLPMPELLSVLRWLQPSSLPRITIKA